VSFVAQFPLASLFQKADFPVVLIEGEVKVCCNVFFRQQILRGRRCTVVSLPRVSVVHVTRAWG
jgi:hypothetical protein